MKQKILFIINPISGIGKSKKVEHYVELYLNKELFDYQFIYTNRRGHAIEISKENSNNFDIIVAVGGDGSVNEVSQGLINSKCVLAIIPSGSGNGFARYLKIPRSIHQAIDIINQNNIKQVDTIKINNKYFVNIAGIGFDAKIAHDFSKTKRRGFLPYLIYILEDLTKYKAEKYTFLIDGKKIKREIFLTVFANSSQWGFGAEISPDAKIDDGLMNVCIFNKFPIIEVPFLTGKLFDKTIQNSRHYENYLAKEVLITCENPNIVAHIDGEPVVFKNKIKIKMAPMSLNVMVPNKKRRFMI